MNAPTFPRYDELSRDGLTPTMRNDVSRLYESTNIMRENASSVNLRHLPRHLPVFHRQLGHHGPETVIIVPPVMSTETGIGIADMTEIDIHLAMSKPLFCLSWLLNFN